MHKFYSSSGLNNGTEELQGEKIVHASAKKSQPKMTSGS